MSEHRVSIKDKHGASITVQVSLPPGKSGRWRSLVLGGFRYEEGAAATDRCPRTGRIWLSLYGGDEAEDKYLVLHLDDFLAKTGRPNKSGDGKAYPQDDVCMRQGGLTWELLA